MDILVNRFPRTVDKAEALQQFKMGLELLDTPRTKGKPLGWTAKEDWDEPQTILKEGGRIKATVPSEQLYSNDLLPK